MQITLFEFVGLVVFLSIPVLLISTGLLVLFLFRRWSGAKVLRVWVRLAAVAASQILALVGSVFIDPYWPDAAGDVMVAQAFLGPLIVAELVVVPVLLACVRMMVMRQSRSLDGLPTNSGAPSAKSGADAYP